jgi:hypothetical protein
VGTRAEETLRDHQILGMMVFLQAILGTRIIGTYEKRMRNRGYAYILCEMEERAFGKGRHERKEQKSVLSWVLLGKKLAKQKKNQSRANQIAHISLLPTICL